MLRATHPAILFPGMAFMNQAMDSALVYSLSYGTTEHNGVNIVSWFVNRERPEPELSRISESRTNMARLTIAQMRMHHH